MRKPAINFSIDIFALLAFIFLISTGFLIYLVLPAGSGGASVWGMNRHEWRDIHFWIAMAFITLIAIHFILHWDWIKNIVRGKAKDKTISGFRISAAIIALVFILLLALAPFLSTVDHSSQDRGRNAPGIELKK
jgi:hypothetical protein